MRRQLVGALALLFAACGGGGEPTSDSPRETARTINGSITLKDTYRSAANQPCSGKGGYSDLRAGTQVTVKDGTGELLAIGQLADGRTVDAGQGFDMYEGTFNQSHCRLEFVVPNVPVRPFYEVEVSHRGSLSYSQEDLAERGWRVEFTVG